MFSVGKTDPYCANACRELTTHLMVPEEKHWKSLSHLVGYLRGHYRGLKMRPPKEQRALAFVDSDYASDRNNRKSITGYLVTIGSCLIAWQSKKQSSITLSSTKAKLVVMSICATVIKFVVSLMTEIYKQAPLYCQAS